MSTRVMVSVNQQHEAGLRILASKFIQGREAEGQSTSIVDILDWIYQEAIKRVPDKAVTMRGAGRPKLKGAPNGC